jgi:adenylate cyclase
MLGRMAAPSSAPLDPEIARALFRETLRSERLRTRVLFVTLCTILAVGTVSWLTIGPEWIERASDGRFRWWMPPLVILPFIAYEAMVGFVVIDRFLRRGSEPPAVARYANATIEITAPTAIIYFTYTLTGEPGMFAGASSLAYFLFIVAATLRLNFALPAFTGAVAALQYLVLAWWLLPLEFGSPELLLTPQYHAAKAMVVVIAGLIAGLVAQRLRAQLIRLLEEMRAKERVTSVFGQHVSPAVAERLIHRGDAPGELRHVAVLFLDISGFTAQSRSRKPAEVVAFLNRAFAAMIEAIDRRGGIVNKFLGDGFMAVFGAPLDDAHAVPNAVAAARDILAEIDRDGETGDWPLTVRIGIHAGPAVTGNVGSPRRREFTVIGDTVNLAARLEQLNKELGSRLLVSEAVMRALDGEAAGAETREMAIRGYDRPVRVAVLDDGSARPKSLSSA